MSKVYTLHDAIEKFVHSGDHISFGGFTTNRKPYAAVHEILRQGQKDFIVEAGPAGGDWDLLIGEGRVKAYINCYTANSGYTNVSRRFRKAVEKGEILMEDYSQDVVMLMLHAASLGLPYLPVRLMMGSGLTDMWGISKEQREAVEKLPDDKFVYVENPFKKGEKVVAVPVPEIPSQCYNYYDYDKDYFIAYDKASKTDEDFKAFVDEWVYGVKTHEEYLDKLGASRLINLINTPGLGYSENLNK